MSRTRTFVGCPAATRLRTLRIVVSILTLWILWIPSSTLEGQDFWQRTAGPEGGWVQALHRHTNGDLFLSMTFSHRVYRSTDNGSTWQKTGLEIFNEVDDFVSDSQGNLFAGVGCNNTGGVCTDWPSGVYRSADNGESWSRVGMAGEWVKAMLVSSRGEIFAGTAAGDIFRSVDGGSTWTRVHQVGTDWITSFAEVNGTLFVSAGRGGLLRSTNNGTTWSSVSFPCGSSCSSGPGRPNIEIIAVDGAGTLFAGTEPEGLFKSSDNGTTWSAISGLPELYPGVSVVTHITFSGSEIVVTVPFLGLYRSVDGGSSWTAVLENVNPNDIIIGNEGVILVGLDNFGGVVRSSDQGATWTASNGGLIDTYVPQMVAGPRSLFAGAGNGLFRTRDLGATWDRLEFRGEFALNSRGELYLTSDLVMVSRDDGDSWQALESTASLVSAPNLFFGPIATNADDDIFVAVIDQDPGDGDQGGLFRSMDGGMTWAHADNGLTLDIMSLLRAADDGTLFAGGMSFDGSGGKLLRSKDKGNSWTTLDLAPDRDREPHDIAFYGDCTMFVAWRGLFRSDDCGDTWVDVTNGIAGKQVASHTEQVWSVLVTQEGDVYAGGYQAGVARSTDMGATWTPVSDGIEKPPGPIPGPGDHETVWSFAVANGFLFAGTQNSGIYRSVERVTSVPTPSLEIVWPAPGMTLPSQGAAVKVAVENFVLDCDNIGGAPVPGNGHLHISVDGALDTVSCQATTSLTNPLTPGAHTIEVELRTNDHLPYDPPVKASVDVHVDAGSVTYTPTSVVTGVARTSGAGGSFFKTSLWITAPEGASMLRLEFVPAPGQPAADFPSVALTVGAKESFAFGDALKNAFGVTEGTFGNIVVSVADGSVKPKISARTFNDQSANGKGTFGQFIPEIELMQQSAKRSPFDGSDIRLDGLSASPAFRSNVGIVNLDLTGTLSATIQILDASSMPTGDPIAVQVPPGSLVQTNAVGASPGFDTFSVSISADGPFSAYASKLDNTTSDSIFILDSASSESAQWIDGVGSVQGGGGTFFKSELSLTNRSGADAAVTISLVERGATSPTATVDVDLAAGESLLYGNSVKELFDLDGVAGAFWLTGPSGISAWARTYNDLTESGGQGSFGQFIPAFDSTDLIGVSGAIIPGLSQNAAFRTNAGFVNVGLVDASVTVSVWSSDGQQLGEKGYFVPAGTAVFVSQIIADIGVASLSDGYIKLMPSTGGAVYGWASSVDNVSTDQTFFRPFNLETDF